MWSRLEICAKARALLRFHFHRLEAGRFGQVALVVGVISLLDSSCNLRTAHSCDAPLFHIWPDAMADGLKLVA